MTFFDVKIASSLVVLALTAANMVKAGDPLLKPNPAQYRYHCEKEAGPTGSDPNWPCFHFNHGDLKSAGIELLNNGNGDINNIFFVKDDAQTDFTVSPSIPFKLKWHDDFVLTYSNYADGCFDIQLERYKKSGQFWVSDDYSNDRDIDTWNWPSTRKRLCTKWVHIYVQKGGVIEEGRG